MVPRWPLSYHHRLFTQNNQVTLTVCSPYVSYPPDKGHPESRQRTPAPGPDVKGSFSCEVSNTPHELQPRDTTTQFSQPTRPAQINHSGKGIKRISNKEVRSPTQRHAAMTWGQRLSGFLQHKERFPWRFTRLMQQIFHQY